MSNNTKEKSPYEVVKDLNEELHEKNKNYNMWFSYTLFHYIDSVAFNFFGENSNIKIELWNSEDSQRKWENKTKTYEPLEKTIRREFKLCVKELNKVKL